MPSPRDLLDELKRRRVFRVAAGYAVVGWVVVEVTSTIFPELGLPVWTVPAVIVIVLLGFPAALVLAWAFEVTGGELRRTPGTRATPARLAAGGVAAVTVLTTLAAGVFMVRARAADGGGAEAAVPAPPRASIAVLPFSDLSPLQDQEHFGQGLAEELLNVLAQTEGLRVAARTSSFAMAGPDAAPVTEIGRALGVATVLEGSVRVADGTLRVTAQLIDARDGMHIWSEVYERDPTDVFAIQDEIAAAIANALELRLLGHGVSPYRSRPRDPEAYQAYLRGRYAWNRRTAEGLEESLLHFERAVAIDPAYALGYAGIADAYMLLEDFGRVPRDEAFSKGTAAARRALQLDEALPEAHTSLAHILMHQLEFDASEQEFRRSLDLNPNQATAHQWYAVLLLMRQRWDEADRHARRAVELDPLSIAPLRTLAIVPLMARRPEEAIRRLQGALERFPDADQLLDWLVSAYIHAGRPEDAARIAELLYERHPGRYYEARRALAYAAADRDDEARRLLAEIEADPPSAHKVALVYAYLGDLDRAFLWLDRSVDRREAYLDFLPIDALFDPLREDPRFRDALRKTGHVR